MLNRPAEHSQAFELPDVGLYVDDERSIAAVSRPSRANSSLHIASLHRTVLYVHADGSASLGGTDDPYAAEFTDFVDSQADTRDTQADARDAQADSEVESGFEPGELVAMTLRCLLAEVAHSLGTDPTLLATAATFPSRWTAEQVSALRTEMNRYELGHVALVAESEALTAWASTTQATWAGSDSGIAAARGAASIASQYPVDAVTEEIPISRTVRPAGPLWTRTPVLAAVAFAAVLALGSGVVALMLQDSSGPSVPVIEGAPLASPSTTAVSTPGGSVPFPTVVPIAEPIAPAPRTIESEETSVRPIEPPPATEPTTELPQTRPVAEESETPEQPVEVPTPPDEDTDSDDEDAEVPDETGEPDENSGENPTSETATDSP